MAALQKVALGILEQKALVARLAAGAGIQEMFERHGALGRADHPDFAPLGPPHPVSKLCRQPDEPSFPDPEKCCGSGSAPFPRIRCNIFRILVLYVRISLAVL